MTENTVNIPLLRKAVEWAEAEAAKPDQKQSAWMQEIVMQDAESVGRECGTCYCIAGYVGELVDPGTPDLIGTAIQALGLDPGANGLFQSDNTIEDVRRIAESIAGESL